ncbi:MAG: amidohydrolase family protein [Thermodesulfobacteriota bacterium]
MKPSISDQMKTGQPVDNHFLKIPLFHDAHMHFMVNGHQANLDDYSPLAREYLSRGILSVVDMGHKSGLGLEIKKSRHEGEWNHLRISSAGWALSKKGAYGGFLGKGITGEKEIKTAINDLTLAGVDFIKIINSGIVSFRENDRVAEGCFSKEDWKIIREEADRHHLKIRCHANTDRSIRQAIISGVSSIEHGFFVSQETLREMAEKDISWTPTASALMSIKSFLPEEGQRHLDQIMDNHLKAVYYGASIGVKLQVGTDSGAKGVKPGESFFKELQLFKKAGLSLGQIVSAACLPREEIEGGNFLLVEKNFIEQERVGVVFVNGDRVTDDQYLQSPPSDL